MRKNLTFRIIVLIAFMFVKQFAGQAFAQTVLLERNLWYNEGKTSKIQIYKAKDGKFYGKIVWLKVTEENGKPRTDSKNPDKAKQSAPLLGLLILNGFKKESEALYDEGTIYDPKNGKTYSCKITNEDGKLNVRGYVGFSIIGRTTVWTKAE